MCDIDSDPSMHGLFEQPAVTKPRVYDLSGQPAEPKPSVALAAIGDLLNEAEVAYERSGHDPEVWLQVTILIEARRRVARAEAAQ